MATAKKTSQKPSGLSNVAPAKKSPLKFSDLRDVLFENRPYSETVFKESPFRHGRPLPVNFTITPDNGRSTVAIARRSAADGSQLPPATHRLFRGISSDPPARSENSMPSAPVDITPPAETILPDPDPGSPSA